VRVYATAHADGTRAESALVLMATMRVLGFSGLPPRARVRAAPLHAPGLDARHALAFGADERTLLPGTDWTLRYRPAGQVAHDGTLDLALPAGSALLLHTS
jgi:hypothetical protein